jgi:hypothetical protein
MGLLDDLKQQAESRKVQEQANEAQKAQNLQEVNTALRGVFQYFIEFANSLNILKPEIARTFYIDSTTKFDRFGQGQYRVRDRRKTVDHKDYFEEVTVRFSWTGSQPLVVEKDTPALIQRLRESLAGYNLRYECREVKNERGVVERAIFTIEPEVIADAAFAGNWDTGKVRLTLKNVETLGAVDFQYETAEVDGGLFEELAKLLLAKPNNLRNLGKYQELLRTAPRLRSTASETQYLSAPAEPKGGLLGGLKSILGK